MDNKFLEQPHETTKVKKIIGVVSGKGGVGKSLVTSLLAVAMANKGKKVAILDADITGPSIPKVFGIKDKPFADNKENIFPVKSKKGISIISANLLLEKETDPVIWRGPVITGVIKQFWKNVIWNELDYMFIDMPPGTGDVPLTVFQTIPVNGIIVVTSPQELVSMIVEKAVNMAKMMDIPVLGLVENMSYIKCPDCGKEIKIFGESKIDNVAKKFGISAVDKMAVNPEIASLCDKGEIENAPGGNLRFIIDNL